MYQKSPLILCRYILYINLIITDLFSWSHKYSGNRDDTNVPITAVKGYGDLKGIFTYTTIKMCYLTKPSGQSCTAIIRN